jgi:hypothetical protein
MDYRRHELSWVIDGCGVDGACRGYPVNLGPFCHAKGAQIL